MSIKEDYVAVKAVSRSFYSHSCSYLKENISSERAQIEIPFDIGSFYCLHQEPTLGQWVVPRR